MSTWNFVIKDSNALQICKGKEVVCEARSAYSAHRLAKLLNLGLQVERERAANRPCRNASPAPDRDSVPCGPPVYVAPPSPDMTFEEMMNAYCPKWPKCGCPHPTMGCMDNDKNRK